MLLLGRRRQGRPRRFDIFRHAAAMQIRAANMVVGTVLIERRGLLEQGQPHLLIPLGALTGAV